MDRHFRPRNASSTRVHLAIASGGLQKDRMGSRTIQIATFARVFLNLCAIRTSSKRPGLLVTHSGGVLNNLQRPQLSGACDFPFCRTHESCSSLYSRLFSQLYIMMP